MTNYEYYKYEVIRAVLMGSVCNLVELADGITCDSARDCSCCRGHIASWLKREHYEDWEKVPVDAKVIVNVNGKEVERHFAKYEEGFVCVWDTGHTSWSSKSDFAKVTGYAPENVRLIKE